ncbi:MAG TPA: 6-carboxytetrahydropterin synthase [Syntrophomonadaceae bacterium]|nr:6-carboxytetrahydropterin synthase [Syntrophomonadaceae bacterium]
MDGSMLQQGAKDMENSHPLDGQTRDKNVINAMTAELQNILNRHQLVMQRLEELAAQIGIFEKRQEYVQAALEESRRIAAEISSDALQRVNTVMSNAQKVIDPQQAEIARLEAQIAELKQDLAERPPEEITPPLSPPLTVAQLPEFELAATEALDSDLTGPYRSRDDQRHSALRPTGKISVLEIHPENNHAGDLGGADTKNEAGAQAAHSDLNIASPTMDTYIKPLSVDKEYILETEAAMIHHREFSLREPEDVEIFAKLETGSKGDKPVDNNLSIMAERDSSRPESFATKPDQSAPEEQPEVELNLPPMSVITSERTELAQTASKSVEFIEERENSSIMHLDVFLDARHYHFVDPWNKQDHRHRWQVKVQVEVPRDQEIAYSQLLSAVNSTLLKYDDVLLNETFPFDHIDPSHENVAGYFFNCLEDMVAAKGLRLVEVGLWEKQNLVLQVHARNGDIDAQLRGENDLNQIRASLYHEPSSDAETSFRKMLGMMFKNRK